MALPQSVIISRGLNTERACFFRTPAQSAAGADVEQFFYLDGRVAASDTGGVVDNLIWVPDAAITGVNTHNVVISINHYTNAGVLAGVVGTVTFALNTNGAKGVGLVIAVVAAYAAYTAGETFSFLAHQSDGTGLALPTGVLAFEYHRV